jgi:CBS domain-containing protein
MKLKEIMTRNVEAISSDSSLVEAANKMARLDIGFLPVLDGDGISGVVTDRDIVVRAIATGRDASSTKVSEILTGSAEILSEDQEAQDAAKLMKDKQIRRVLVADDSGAYVGVVSLGDLAVEGHEPDLCGEAMEKVCKS